MRQIAHRARNHVEARQPREQVTARQREAILDRMRWGATPGYADGADYGRLPAAYTADLPGRRAAPTPVAVRTLDPRVFGLWGQGFGSFGQARTDGNAASLSRQTSGFVLGADVRLESGFRVGVAGGSALGGALAEGPGAQAAFLTCLGGAVLALGVAALGRRTLQPVLQGGRGPSSAGLGAKGSLT